MENEVPNVDDVIETANHFRCIDIIIDNAKTALTEKFIKELHLILKNGTSDSRKDGFAVGDYKKLPNEVGGMDTALPEEAADKMKALLTEYNAREEKTFEYILDFHAKFERIHPFQDGNGRMSRLLTTLLLYKSDYVVGKYISLESKIAKNKNLYYQALEECQNGWHEGEENVDAFIKYILQTVLATYRDFEDRVDVVGEKLTATELVRRAVSRKYGKITKSDIMELCPTIGQKSVEASIKKLVDVGVLTKQGNGRGTYYLRND